MAFGAWKYDAKLGKFVAASDHNQNSEPTQRGIVIGKPCGGAIRNPTHLTLSEQVRKRYFDKPSESQIKQLIEEDQVKSHAAEVVRESKQDLESGKMRINLEVINQRGKRIIPFGHITDDRGITHIVPEDKAKAWSEKDLKSLENSTRREIEERMAKTEIKVPGAVMRIERPKPCAPPPGEVVLPERHFIDAGLEAVKQGTHKGRTVG